MSSYLPLPTHTIKCIHCGKDIQFNPETDIRVTAESHVLAYDVNYEPASEQWLLCPHCCGYSKVELKNKKKHT